MTSEAFFIRDMSVAAYILPTGWPLLKGERAHYELARGNRAEARRLLGLMAKQTSPVALIPEQVWDAADIPERELEAGVKAEVKPEWLALHRVFEDNRPINTVFVEGLTPETLGLLVAFYEHSIFEWKVWNVDSFDLIRSMGRRVGQGVG